MSDSELEQLILLKGYELTDWHDPYQYDSRMQLKAALKEWAAQEANQAVVAELEKLLQGVTVPSDSIGILSGSMIREYLTNRIKALTSDNKE